MSCEKLDPVALQRAVTAMSQAQRVEFYGFVASPAEAAQYFHKTECFCFTQQTLQPGERIEMPVRFIVDRDMPKEVKHLTLAYTLFDITAAR